MRLKVWGEKKSFGGEKKKKPSEHIYDVCP